MCIWTGAHLPWGSFSIVKSIVPKTKPASQIHNDQNGSVILNVIQLSLLENRFCSSKTIGKTNIALWFKITWAHRMLAPNVNVWPAPAGLIEGWRDGYKKNSRVLQPGTWSIYLQCRYSKLCRLFNSGIGFRFLKQSTATTTWWKVICEFQKPSHDIIGSSRFSPSII